MVGGQGGGTFQGRNGALEETKSFSLEDSASIQNGLKLGAWAPSGKANLVSVSRRHPGDVLCASLSGDFRLTSWDIEESGSLCNTDSTAVFFSP